MKNIIFHIWSTCTFNDSIFQRQKSDSKIKSQSIPYLKNVISNKAKLVLKETLNNWIENETAHAFRKDIPAFSLIYLASSPLSLYVSKQMEVSCFFLFCFISTESFLFLNMIYNAEGF